MWTVVDWVREMGLCSLVDGCAKEDWAYLVESIELL